MASLPLLIVLLLTGRSARKLALMNLSLSSLDEGWFSGFLASQKSQEILLPMWCSITARFFGLQEYITTLIIVERCYINCVEVNLSTRDKFHCPFTPRNRFHCPSYSVDSLVSLSLIQCPSVRPSHSPHTTPHSHSSLLLERPMWNC